MLDLTGLCDEYTILIKLYIYNKKNKARGDTIKFLSYSINLLVENLVYDVKI